MMKYFLTLAFSALFLTVFAQTGKISGRVYNAINKNPLANAGIKVQSTDKGVYSDSMGHFSLKELKAGLYNLEVRHTGFETTVEYEIRVLPNKPVYIEIRLLPIIYGLNEVVVSEDNNDPILVKTLSLERLTHSEMQRMPGATIDLSKSIRNLPGVLPQGSFGYNIVVRGGAPNENSYYLDGIKIPAITHFNVQGASGGANGLVNLDFVRNMNLHKSSFPVDLGNSLSSVMQINQREARQDRIGARFTLGATDAGLTLEGPLGKKANFIMSGRRSFSEHLLAAFGVPVLPQYSDMQFRLKYKADEKNEILVTGLAGFDNYWLNTDAEESDALLYNVGYIPEGNQRLYAYGMRYRHYLDKSFYSFVLSRNGLVNNADKFKNNTGLEADRLLKYRSGEAENHMRFSHHVFRGKTEMVYGATYIYSRNYFDVNGYDVRPSGLDTVAEDKTIDYGRYGFFASLGKRYFDKKLALQASMRIDGSQVVGALNPLNQLSPRLKASYQLHEHLLLNAGLGRYYQLPTSIILAFNRDPETQLNYVQSDQLNLGFEFVNSKTYKFRLNGYYKGYSDYPFLLGDSIAYANAMADHVAVGNQNSEAIGEGRAYGVEMFIKQHLKRNYWWTLAYTFGVSEFKDRKGEFRPGSFDSRHFASFIAGKQWDSGWMIGLRWVYSSGTPYTPYNIPASALKDNWDVANRGLFDYTRLNENRLPAYHQMDFRVDKRWHMKNWNMNWFLDLQNIYSSNIQLLPYLTVDRDEDFNPITNPNDPNRYRMELISSDTGRSLFTLGIVIEI